MLVPLTSSMYAEGTVSQPDRVLLDIGTGYYLEVKFFVPAQTKLGWQNYALPMI